MQKYKSNITSTTGAAIRNVPVMVLAEAGELASLFLDRAGAIAAPNPLTTDSSGNFYFYAVNGRYSLRTTVEGVTITDDDVVLLQDPEEITVAGPIAEAILRAEAAATRAENAVEDSGIPDLVTSAQNAVTDAQEAVDQAGNLTALVNQALVDAQQAKVDAETAAQTAANDAAAAAQLVIEDAVSDAQSAAGAAGQSASDASNAAATAATDAVAAAQSAVSGAVAAAQAAQGQAETARGEAVGARGAAETARDQAQGYAASMGQAIAMADTFTAVPVTFQAWCIAVTLPHLRLMVWDAAQLKYVRAPWHQPCQLFMSYDNPASIPGALPVRADATWQQADFPDVVERLGLSGTGTFTLVEARGEGLRVLDNGRGVDAGRVIGSAQGDAGRNLTGEVGYLIGNSSSTGAFTSDSPQSQTAAAAGGPLAYMRRSLNASLQWPVANEFRMRNIVFPLWMTI